MNEKFQAQIAEARRSLILEAAIAVIAEKGFQRTTIKQIATMAGVADGTIYNYFKNKDAILLAIFERLTEAETREIDFAAGQMMDFASFIKSYVPHRMKEVDDSFEVMKALMPETIVNADLAAMLYERVYQPGFEIAEQFMAQLMSEGEVDSAEPAILSRLFAAPLLGLLFLRLIGDDHVSANWDAYSEPMAQFMIKGIGRAGEDSAESNEKQS